MTPIKRGEIYWVNLDPTVSSEIQKKRPALVVSNDIGNHYSPLVTIVPISSSIHKPYPFEVLIEAGDGGIKKQSLAKANQVRTIDKQRIVGPAIGPSVGDATLKKVEQALRIHLGL